MRTANKEVTQAYEEWIYDLAKKYEKKTFLAKKGDILLWHGMLIHGGDQVNRPELTRKSYVCHYIADGMNKYQEIEGPFNW